MLPSHSILQVVPALDAGGVERTTLEVCEAIRNAGATALVASRGGRLEPDLKAAGGELIRLPMDTKNPAVALLNAFDLETLIKSRNISLVHARSRAPAWSALLAARRCRVPFVTTYHGVYNARSSLKRYYNGVMGRGDVVIANSNFTRAHVIAEHKLDPGRVVTIPRCVDPVHFDPEAVSADRVEAINASWGLRPGSLRPPIIFAPARLTRWKGQTVLIEAAAQLERKREGAALFVIAGDPQGRSDFVRELHELAESLGVGDRVRIAPHIHDMPAALLACDIACFPSIEPEAFGRGAIEAQAMARPVVVSGIGGMAETILDGVTGLHVPPQDPTALAAAFETLLGNPEQCRAMGERGQARVKELYSVAALQDATVKVYRQLLKGAE
jgi:glycosyltransferase involved in cell wall biosynthesis